MKNILFLFFCIGFWANVSAQMANTQNLCSVIIGTPNNEPVTILLDNVIQNTTPQPSVTLDNIPAGTHNVKVNRHSSMMQYTVVDKTVLLYPSTRATYQLQVNSMYQYDLVPVGTQAWNTAPVFTPPIQGYNGPYGCGAPSLGANDFQALKAAINQQSFSDTKKNVAKQAINSNCLLSSQVAELVGLFSFDSDRLDIAKYCYKRTCDQGRYFVVNSAFSFSSSVDELNQYIQQTGSGQFDPGKMQNWNNHHNNNNNNNNVPPPIEGYNGPYGCPAPSLNAAAFQQAKQSISASMTDNSRMIVAKQVISNNCLLASQVGELMRLMTFESSKLTLAKFAYRYTCDKGRYYLVNPEFKISTSVSELANYIQQQ